jgi:hypothetical protein
MEKSGKKKKKTAGGAGGLGGFGTLTCQVRSDLSTAKGA